MKKRSKYFSSSFALKGISKDLDLMYDKKKPFVNNDSIVENMNFTPDTYIL
ncbi:MAG: hypothetical protein ACLTAI_14965 [Thomasclavelia sp.]